MVVQRANGLYIVCVIPSEGGKIILLSSLRVQVGSSITTMCTASMEIDRLS